MNSLQKSAAPGIYGNPGAAKVRDDARRLYFKR